MKFWNNYHKEYLHFQKNSHSMKVFIEEILKEGEIISGNRVLDAGCGNGTLLTRLDQLQIETFGLDFSTHAIELARNRISKSVLIQHDLKEKLPFNNGYFDKIFCINTLYSLGKNGLYETLREFNRTLKDGGLLVVSDPKPKFNNISIFITDIKKYSATNGAIKSIVYLIKNSIRYIKLLYYNILIDFREKNKHYFYPTKDEYIGLLNSLNFSVMKVREVYNGQNNLIVARKNG